jgi:hypothetical protein
MEAIYKLNAAEINSGFMEAIKKLFKDKEITISITVATDETTYLTMNPVNEKHLMDSIAQEPSVRFTPDEFADTVSKL